MISTFEHEVGELIFGLLEYFKDVHGFDVQVLPIQQGKNCRGVGAIVDSRHLFLDEAFLNQDPRFALYALLHLAGHGQQLRDGDTRALDLATVKYDWISAHPDEAAAQIQKNTDLDLDATHIGWAFFKDAVAKSYIKPDLIKDAKTWVEHYFALDMAQYRDCIEHGPMPLYGAPTPFQKIAVIRWADLGKQYIKENELPEVPRKDHVIRDGVVIFHVQPYDDRRRIRVTRRKDAAMRACARDLTLAA